MPDFNKTPRVVTAFYPQLKQVPAQLTLVKHGDRVKMTQLRQAEMRSLHSR
jgi:hypothetical protein